MQMFCMLAMLLTCALPVTVSASKEKEDLGAASYVLLGGMAVIMSIFYLVNSSNQSIVKSTWAMINSAVSIFCAVLTFSLMNMMLNTILGLKEPDEGMPPSWGRVCSAAIQLVGWWYTVVLVLFFVKRSLLHLKGYGTVGGHILGFAALNLYGNIALTSSFRVSPWWTLLDIALAFVTMAMLFLSSRFVHRLVKAHGLNTDAEDEHWHEQSLDTGNDFFALCLGFLMTMLFRFVISGSCPPIDGELGGKLPSNVFELIAAGFATLAFASFFAVLLQKAEENYGRESNEAYLAEFVASVQADAAAFSFLFAAMWQVGDRISNKVLAHTVIAHGFSLIAVSCVFIIPQLIACFGSSATWLKWSYTAIGLAMGLSWEKTFDASLDGLGDLGWFSSSQHQLQKALLMAVLILIAFPAWMVYILPKSDDELKKVMSQILKKGNLPIRAFWSDEDLYDDAGVEADEGGQGGSVQIGTSEDSYMRLATS